jgi:glycosyltransferase involved in cell wall biosynthesis
MQYTKQVSIIISAFNSEKYIQETLNSVLSQTWKNLEIIVVNDGSTDNTLAVANQYINRGVKVISQENKGQDAALNNGYKNCSGDYIKFMDSDDLINPEMIERQMNVLNGSNEYIAYGEWARFYNDDLGTANFKKLNNWRDMTPIDFLTSENIGPMLQCGIMLVPRNLIEKSGLWDERLILFNDTEFYTRLLLNSKGIKFSEGARLYYRSGLTGSISVQRSRKFFESTFLATQLMSEHLFSNEDSNRTRRLIANIFFNQYFEMYPRFVDLAKKHLDEINACGGATTIPAGGKVFVFLRNLLGWKLAKRIQLLFYKLGYKPVITKLQG